MKRSSTLSRLAKSMTCPISSSEGSKEAMVGWSDVDDYRGEMRTVMGSKMKVTMVDEAGSQVATL